jgi:hypothetical protein
MQCSGVLRHITLNVSQRPRSGMDILRCANSAPSSDPVRHNNFNGLTATSTPKKYVFRDLSTCRKQFSEVMELPIYWAEWAVEGEPEFEDDSGLV